LGLIKLKLAYLVQSLASWPANYFGSKRRFCHCVPFATTQVRYVCTCTACLESQVLEEIWSLIEDLGLLLEQDPYCDWVADWITELCEKYMLVSIPRYLAPRGMPDIMIVPLWEEKTFLFQIASLTLTLILWLKPPTRLISRFFRSWLCSLHICGFISNPLDCYILFICKNFTL